MSTETKAYQLEQLLSRLISVLRESHPDLEASLRELAAELPPPRSHEGTNVRPLAGPEKVE